MEYCTLTGTCVGLVAAAGGLMPCDHVSLVPLDGVRRALYML